MTAVEISGSSSDAPILAARSMNIAAEENLEKVIVELTLSRRLNRYVRHFEPLSYEPRPVHREHIRVRRSLGGSDSRQQRGVVYLRFQGFDRLFHLKLRPDASVFHKDLVVETSSLGRVKPNIGHIYSGELIGDPSSRVHGGLHDGVFEGSIQSRWGRFYVEGAHKFFERRTPFHSVMYAAKDASMPDEGWCGVNSETARWMQELAASSKLAQEPLAKEAQRSSRSQHWTNRKLLEESEELYSDMEDGGSVASLAKKGEPTLRVCGLHIAIDHLLYKKYLELDNDDVRTRERISTLIAGHVARACEVYRRTDFQGIHDINDTKSCPKQGNDFCLEKMDPSLLLLTTARSANYDDYCLAFTWTYRDFANGVLGLAYVANATASTMGVCDKNRLVPKDKSGKGFGLSKLSLNTGIITFINYGAHVARVVSEITFCHEMGHNFGSPHDEPDSSPCVPKDKNAGTYIMYWQTTKGTLPNNHHFSQCSVSNMSNVIKPMLQGTSKRENCFEADSGPICGNGLVEGEEQCDCGYTETECQEKCCYARKNSVKARGCTLKPGATCSTRSGLNASCPLGKPKPNNTVCNKGRQVCIEGECLGSICLKYGMQPCYLTGDRYTVDEKCLIACENKGKCKDACHYPAMKSLCGARMPPGSVCDGHGYCDIFQKCRYSDELGSLTKLEDALFASKSYKSVEEYIKAHPFKSFFYLLLFVGLMALFFHCFSAHTPSSHPLRPQPNKSATDVRLGRAVFVLGTEESFLYPWRGDADR
ncbi:disintegrin and metalloproteinase domain-containing protein 10-like [Rhipicephalus sanguineus]|uniref:disintegrin and metalloproteinase domain-containing protein 10-like n=1 Tax=Rhipicephalus sanguineus TaxID=34632 RepID=UPI0020C1C139|nr:disintegrin and metalloproteinase domain-containing protein 10-like [Rhipicephalus sanguineus]